MNITNVVTFGLFVVMGTAFVGIAGFALWAQLKRDEPWVLVDETGRQVSDVEFREVARFTRGLAPARIDSVWGYVDRSGAWAISPQFPVARPFDDSGYAQAQAPDGALRGLLDSSGQWAIEPQFLTFGTSDSSGLVAVRQSIGFNRGSGTQRVSAGLFDLQTGSWRVVPTETEERWTDIRGPAVDGRLAVQQAGRWHVADTQGNRISSADWEQLWAPSEGRFSFEEGGRRGFVDLDGLVVVPARYGPLSALHGGVASASVTGGNRLIDRDGTQIGPVFRRLQSPAGGLVAAQQTDGAWGFVDSRGEWVLPPQWSAVGEEGFRYGVVRVALDSGGTRLWQWIDVDGQTIGPQAAELTEFVQGRGFVRGAL